MAFVFGAELTVAGVIGLVMGSGMSYKLRDRFPWIDPTICGVSLLISSPFIFVGIGFAVESIALAMVMVFFGEVFLNMNWAVAVDISLVC